MTWQPIETAPKDGSGILVLSIPYDADMGDEMVHFPAKAAFAEWNPEGDSWVCTDIEKETYELQVTGFWSSGGGWFQPDEVSHWMPIPEPPK